MAHNENIVTAESASDEAKIGYTEKEDTKPQTVAETYDDDSKNNLHRGLKSRQISMIAIGGAIGTGLIIGTYVNPAAHFPSPARARSRIRVHQATQDVVAVPNRRQYRRTPACQEMIADQHYRGQALVTAGPGSLLIAYAAVGLLVYMVMAALGEMAAWLPLASGFTGYAHRFVDPALGFSLGYTYWFKVRRNFLRIPPTCAIALMRRF